MHKWDYYIVFVAVTMFPVNFIVTVAINYIIYI